MSSTVRLASLFGLLAVIITLLAAAPAAQAQSAYQRCFPETGQCISGVFLEYWERNGGLAVFGYPISPVRTERVEGSWVGQVQWFERDRLEDHTAEGQGVLAGRLAARYLQLQGRSFQPTPFGSTGPLDCLYFPETGQPLCGVFKRYWEQNGGLMRFGYPISPPIVERVGGWTGEVQYFERRRLEHHTELRGTPYEVMLGLLGRHVAAAESALPALPPTERWRLAEVVTGEIDEVIAYVPGPVSTQTIREGTGTAEYPYSATRVALLRPNGSAGYRIYGQADLQGLYAERELASFGAQSNGRRALALNVLPHAQVSISLLPVNDQGAPVAQAVGMYWNQQQGAYRLYANGRFQE